MDFLNLIGHAIGHRVMDALIIEPIKEYFRGHPELKPLFSQFATSTRFQMPVPVLGHVLLWNPGGVSCSQLVNSIEEELCRQSGGTARIYQTTVEDWRSRKLSRQLDKWVNQGDFIILRDAEELGDHIQKWFRSVLQMVSAPGPVAKPFSMLAVTRTLSRLGISLRDRFPIRMEVDPQNDNWIAVFRAHTVALYKPDVDMASFEESWIPKAVLQSNSRSQRMIANHIRAFASSDGEVSSLSVTRALRLIGLDENGLSPTQRRVVSCLILNGNRPMVSSKLASRAQVAEPDLKKLVFPELCKSGIARCVLTGYALTALGVETYECRYC